MTLAVTGLSHHTSPLELRERLAVAEEDLPGTLHRLHKLVPGGGAVILSTCNRVEMYLRADEAVETLHARSRQFLVDTFGVSEAEFADHVYEYHDRDAVAHLFKVASSLDSMVVGEGQILGQVHDAFLAAQTENATDKILGVLFQRAFKVAKEVRTKTEISSGRVSIASVAVDLAVSIFMDLADKTVLVLGSGETGELALKHLVDRGVTRVIVANRTLANATEVASRFQGEAISLDQLRDHLHRADIVIGSTAAEHVILGVSDFQVALKRRNNAPIFAIDIAVPRDIDAAVNTLDNVYLYDVDDLQEVADRNLDARRAAVARSMELVEKQVDLFMQWRQGLHAEPAIVSMTREMHAIRERELEKSLQRLPQLDDKAREEVAYLTKRIVNNILQRPMTQLKKEVTEEDPHRVLHLIRRLFGIEEGA